MTTLDPGPAPVEAPRAPVAVLTPHSVDEALRLLAADGAAVLGGGVGHTLRRHERGPDTTATTLVSVRSLPGLTSVSWSQDHVTIGAGVRLSACAADERLGRIWPVVTEAAASVATGRIRAMVTLGGNIAARDDSHDPPVALTAVGATLLVRGLEGSRTLAIGDLNLLRDDELIEHITLPLPPAEAPGLAAVRTGSAYEKFLVRGVWEYACVNVAAVVGLDPEGRAHRLSLAVGSVAGGPVAIDLSGLLGTPVDRGLIEEAAATAAAATRPYSDVKGSAEYKSRMIAEFSRRALRTAVRRAEQDPSTSGGER
jgi:carbon-monoxide dehydrogenase medium subunit